MKYEIMLILDSKQTDKELNSVLAEVKSTLKEHKFELVDEDIWGHRNLAYTIKGKAIGYYVVMHFVGEPENMLVFKKDLALMGGILRTLIQKVADDSVLLRFDQLQTTKAGDGGAVLSKHAEELSKKVAGKSSSEENETSEEDQEKLDEKLKAIIEDQDIDV